MDATPYLPIVASLIGGGAVGAIITAFVTTFRNRKQPIGRRIDVSPVFTSGLSGPTLTTRITISDGTKNYSFSNLYVADVQIVNQGNRDFDTFTFGLTLSQPDRAIYVEPYGLDRHHVVKAKSICGPDAPSDALDFELKPFNRGDSYPMKIFFTTSDKGPQPIKLSSPEAIRFIEIQSLTEAVATVAVANVLKVGPVEIRLK